ncbi:MAG: hypothetical protein WAV40_02145 [Microgenomates group bacterium]
MTLLGIINFEGDGRFHYMLRRSDKVPVEWVEIAASLGQIIIAAGTSCSVEKMEGEEWRPIFGVENLKEHGSVVVLGGKSITPVMDSVTAEKPIGVVDNDSGFKYANVRVF